MTKSRVPERSLPVSMVILGMTPAMLLAASFDCSKAKDKTEKAVCNE